MPTDLKQLLNINKTNLDANLFIQQMFLLYILCRSLIQIISSIRFLQSLQEMTKQLRLTRKYRIACTETTGIVRFPHETKKRNHK